MKQKIIKVGNSAAVLIPKSVLDEEGVKIGATVNSTHKADMGSYVIDFPKKATGRSPASHEFNRWLDQFIEEDRGLLQELTSR